MVPKKSRFCPKGPNFAFVASFRAKSQIPNPVSERLAMERALGTVWKEAFRHMLVQRLDPWASFWKPSWNYRVLKLRNATQQLTLSSLPYHTIWTSWSLWPIMATLAIIVLDILACQSFIPKTQLELIRSRSGTRQSALSSLQYGALCRGGTCSFCQKMFHVLLSHVFVENCLAIKDWEKLMEQNCFWMIGGFGVRPDLVVKW